MKKLYKHDQIKERVTEIGKRITQDYQDKDPLLIGVLKGATVFMAHLMMEIECDLEIDFITVSSYRDGKESKKLHLIKDLDVLINGRHIIIVEDIIDSGKTLNFLYDYFSEKGAASIATATFVNKETRRTHKVIDPKYVCFEYHGDDFLVGFGFDHAEKYRNLSEVYQLPSK